MNNYHKIEISNNHTQLNITKSQYKTKQEHTYKLTNGILEALSFHTANNPRDAKQLNPPQSQANASYWFQINKKKNPIILCFQFYPEISIMKKQLPFQQYQQCDLYRVRVMKYHYPTQVHHSQEAETNPKFKNGNFQDSGKKSKWNVIG